MSSVQLRPATASDAPDILALIRALATYEREPDEVEVDAPTLAAQLGADAPPFECILAVDGGTAVGFALFFQSYSTWRGRPGLWLEDLFVVPERRGEGIGKRLLKELAALVVARGYARFEWSVLDWNEPAIGFYRSIGASSMDGWTTFRLTGDALGRFAAGTR
jgi:GNAT superfamily N-acetyltransferase